MNRGRGFRNLPIVAAFAVDVAIGVALRLASASVKAVYWAKRSPLTRVNTPRSEGS